MLPFRSVFGNKIFYSPVNSLGRLFTETVLVEKGLFMLVADKSHLDQNRRHKDLVELKKAGFEVLDKPKTASTGHKYSFIKDPDNIYIELFKTKKAKNG